MKKSLIVATLLMIGTSSTLVAGEMGNEWFVGGEFGGMSMHTKTSGSAYIPSQGLNTEGTYKETINSTYEALKMGKYFEFGRIYGSLAYQNKKDDLTSYTFGLGYDYLFKNKSDFTPFIGVNASYSQAKWDVDGAKELSLDKPKGFNYGPEVGLLYSVTKNTELEIGVRYMISDVKDTFSANDGINRADIKLEAEKIIQYYVGLNYKF
ncbi:outer membrane beta-barrel protein [Sulfurospirillum diekertiae]|uniref:Outer membrane beta-barrel protein n=1 Tax=Sulfurospirillum diekertiae TaxID=1854492 RepID=A0A6G9VSU7_9BACT|nr:opacity family porin [Sulfurospirillum diekertiae]QIR76616.1 outer membrane beta-barrel protein [Sulfurospirillum diekertiae]QIR79245.1 outer membrane beta-barrel protein [Sulfurospirillum diekertiae]